MWNFGTYTILYSKTLLAKISRRVETCQAVSACSETDAQRRGLYPIAIYRRGKFVGNFVDNFKACAGRGVYFGLGRRVAAADAATWAPYPMPPSASNSPAEAAQSPQGVGPDTWPYFSMALRYTPSNLVSLLGLLRACFWYCRVRENVGSTARCTSEGQAGGRHNSKKQLARSLALSQPTFSAHFSCIQYFVISILGRARDVRNFSPNTLLL